jgi:hypothetical protein
MNVAHETAGLHEISTLGHDVTAKAQVLGMRGLFHIGDGMLMVPDITAGTGTEFEEMLVCDGSAGLPQSEGAQERVLSVDEFLSEWDCGVR